MFAEKAWLIPLLPAVSFFVILFFGKKLPKGGAESGIFAVGTSFLVAVIVGVTVAVDDCAHEVLLTPLITICGGPSLRPAALPAPCCPSCCARM